MVSLLPTKFHEILFGSFRGVALTNCVMDRTKTICLPTKVGGGRHNYFLYLCSVNIHHKIVHGFDGPSEKNLNLQ
jgi:hypothetical protein